MEIVTSIYNHDKETIQQLKSFQSTCRELEENKSSVQSQIRYTAQRVIDAVKKKEKELLDQLTEVTDKQMDQLKADIKTGYMASNIYRQQTELIDQALNSEGEMDMYDLYQSREPETAEAVGDAKKRGTSIRIEFSQDVNRLERTVSELSLGKIQVLDVFDLDAVSSPVLCQTVDCRTKEDQDKPVVFDIVCMEVKGSITLIVTDLKNECIKSFFKRNNERHQSRLSMKSEPVSISKLDDNKIAVTLPNSKQIAVVSVTPDLNLDSTITTRAEYGGLTTLSPTTLAAGSVSPPCVDVIDVSGNVMRSISPIHNGEKIIQKPLFLCTTRQGNILISDYETKSVVCVTPQGEAMFNYCRTGDRALEGQAGITTTATGHMPLADCDGHKILVLNESGEFVRDLLTSQEGICGPSGIDWDERGQISVAHHYGDGGACVQVFTFK